jgi:hypothetical protein
MANADSPHPGRNGATSSVIGDMTSRLLDKPALRNSKSCIRRPLGAVQSTTVNVIAIFNWTGS